MKRKIAFIAMAAVTAACAVLSLSACDAGYELIYELTDSADGYYYTVTGISNTSADDVVIPAEHDYIPVKKIAFNALGGCTNLTNLTIPFVGSDADEGGYLGYIFGANFSEDNVSCVPSTLESVTVTHATVIGDSAFARCENLRSVTLSSNVTEIGDYAFEGCTSLTEITLSPRTTAIGTRAFEDCTSLKTVTIPARTTQIGDYAFRGCSSLQSIDVEEGNTFYSSIDSNLYHTFNDKCTLVCYAAGNTQTAFTVPENVDYIAEYALFNCNKLISVTVPDGVTDIADCAFQNCSFLAEISLGSGITHIGNSAFGGTAYYKSNAKNGLHYIGNYLLAADDSCEGKVTVKDGTTLIADNAFDSSYVSEIYIPVSVRYIGRSALYCRNLAEIEVAEDNAFFKAADGNLYSKDGTVFLQYAVGNSNTSCTVSGGTTTIADYAFFNSSNLKSVALPDSVTEICAYSFLNCDSLEEISLGSGLQYIGRYAFSRCGALKEVTFPASLKLIDECAFQNCSSLERATFEDHSDWYESQLIYGTTAQIDLPFPEQNAETLTDPYRTFIWYK